MQETSSAASDDDDDGQTLLSMATDCGHIAVLSE